MAAAKPVSRRHRALRAVRCQSGRRRRMAPGPRRPGVVELLLGAWHAAGPGARIHRWRRRGRKGLGIAWTECRGGDRLRTLASALRRRPEGPGSHDSPRRNSAHRRRCRAVGIRLSGQGRSVEAGSLQPRQQRLGSGGAVETGNSVATGAPGLLRGSRSALARSHRSAEDPIPFPTHRAEGPARRPHEASVARLAGFCGADPAPRLHQRREPAVGAYCGSRRGAVHTFRSRGQSGAALAAVADRMRASRPRRLPRRDLCRPLDNIHRGEGSTGSDCLPIVLGSGWPRVGLCHRDLRSQRTAVRRAAVVICRTCPHVRSARLQRHQSSVAGS